jgi:dolichol-phosphate mannosyltransferase
VVLSVVTPALNEAENIPLFHARLVASLDGLDDLAGSWEWIVVDDGSGDGTSDAVALLAARDARVRGVRLPRNLGSHPAILRGLAESRGAAVLVMAADLQDPPELCGDLLARWREGVGVVWAVRRRRDSEARLLVAVSGLYHALLRRWGGARGLPAGGTGFCLFDRRVAETVCRRVPPPVDVFAAAGRLDVRFATIPYDRSARRHGRSGWSWGRKVRFALHSLVDAR